MALERMMGNRGELRPLFRAPLVVTLVLLAAACAPGREPVDHLVRSYARVSLAYDASVLDDRDRAVLQKLWQAARPMEQIFWRQMLPDPERALRQIENSEQPEDRQKLAYFLINYGPWDRLRNLHNFVGGGARPPGAAFYPEGLSSIEFEDFLVRHPALRPQLESATTLVQRSTGGFKAVPYEQEYAGELSESASFLKQAAAASGRPQLARYLRERAAALVQGGYRASDRLWATLRDQPLDIVIGPIETSEDQLLGIRAAYEAAVLLRDPASSQQLQRFSEWAMRFLPETGFHPSTDSPESTEVWQVALFSGQLDAGVKTVALTLPNDEEVRSAMGTRKLIFSNVLRAKFEKVMRPLAEKLLDPESARDVTEEALLQEALLHESCHRFQAGDERLLADLWPVIDELKADLLALQVGARAATEGMMPTSEWRRIQTGHLLGVLRSVRMGVGSPQAQANAVQLDALLAGKALEFSKGIFTVHTENIGPSLQSLFDSVRQLELGGDYAAAEKLLQEKARVPSSIQRKLISLDAIPVDVAFDYREPR